MRIMTRGAIFALQVITIVCILVFGTLLSIFTLLFDSFTVILAVALLLSIISFSITALVLKTAD
jgi:hypothetical protein